MEHSSSPATSGHGLGSSERQPNAFSPYHFADPDGN